MKKLSTYIITLFFITSCELTNVLENDPPNNLVSENVVQNEDDARALLNGTYTMLTHAEFISSYYYMQTELMPSILIGSMVSRSSFLLAGFQDNDLQFDHFDIARYWRIFYRVINQANNVIALTSELPDNEFSENSK